VRSGASAPRAVSGRAATGSTVARPTSSTSKASAPKKAI
jgi:hypothetical protein